MSTFKKYQHIERYGTDEVKNIEVGECLIFPKIDGTNASVWYDGDNRVSAGSRNRELEVGKDNAGFLAAMLQDESICMFLKHAPDLRLFGEWLVPHTLKSYEHAAWRKFYVFDVMQRNTGLHLHYDEYAPLLDSYCINYIPPIARGTNLTKEQLYACLDKNTYLIMDGQGVGEGVVIKNYDFVNQYGRTKWAKIVRNEFKSENRKVFGDTELKAKQQVELKIAEKFVTKALVEKTHAKIQNESGWSSKAIPRLLHTVYYDVVHEDMWQILKLHRNPTIDFGRLQALVYAQAKVCMPELF